LDHAMLYHRLRYFIYFLFILLISPHAVGDTAI
jgi:hypothetical protein